MGWSPVGIAVYAECFLRGDACYVPYQDLMPYCCAVGAGKAHLSFGCHLLENVPYVLKHINDVMNRNQLCKVLSPKSSKTEQIALFRCA